MSTTAETHNETTGTGTRTGTGDVCDAIVRELQRELNLLSEPNRGLRTRALKKIQARVVSAIENDTERPSVGPLFRDGLSGYLLKVFQDPVEKCRFLAAETTKSVLQACECDWFFHDAVSIVRGRFVGSEAETSEELRLLLLELLSLALNQTTMDTDALDKYMTGDLSVLIDKAAADPFPDVKVEIANTCICLIQKIDEYCTESTKRNTYLAGISKAILPNLGHQRSQIRQTTLRCIGAAIRANQTFSEWIIQLFPSVSSLQFDRTPSVRKALIEEAATWLQVLEGEDRNLGDVLLLIVAGIADDIPEIQDLAVTKVQEVAIVLAPRRFTTDTDMDIEVEPRVWEDASHYLSADDRHPFCSRPHDESRSMIRSFLQGLLSTTLSNVSGWKESLRSHAIRVLHVLLIYAEESVIRFIDPILSALYKGLQEDEPQIIENVRKCARVCGLFVDTDAYVTASLRSLKEATGDVNTEARCIVILNALMAGDDPSSLSEHLLRVTSALCTPDICSHSSNIVRMHVLQSVEILLSKMNDSPAWNTPLLSTPIGCLYWAVHQIDAVEDRAGQEVALQQMQRIATKVCGGMVSHLYDMYFIDSFRMILGDSDLSALKWKETSTERYNFVCLMERSSDVINKHLDMVLPVILRMSDPSQDITLRADALSITRHLLSDSTVSWTSWAPTLLREAFLPNTVWRAGKAAAALRLQAMMCIHGLLASQVMDTSALNTAKQTTLPILLSNLDDDDTPIRSEAVHSMRLMLEGIQSDYTTDLADQILTEVAKRLDDSSDPIRIEALATLQAFLTQVVPRTAGWDVNAVSVDHVTKTLVVHLDDMNPEVQEAVFGVLQILLPMHPTKFVPYVRQARDLHRSPVYCDRLLNA